MSQLAREHLNDIAAYFSWQRSEPLCQGHRHREEDICMESATLTIRLLSSELLLQAGSELQAKGMAGRYHVKIKRILAVQEHSDGTVSVEVYATRALIEEQTSVRQPREVKPVVRSLTDEERRHCAPLNGNRDFRLLK